MKAITKPLECNGKVILSDNFIDGAMLYEEKRIVVSYLDGSDPPDILLFIPLDDIMAQPLLEWNDPRIEYEKGKFHVHSESSWSNKIDFFPNYVTISSREECHVFHIDGTKKWTVGLYKAGFKCQIMDVDNDILKIKYVPKLRTSDGEEDESCSESCSGDGEENANAKEEFIELCNYKYFG